MRSVCVWAWWMSVGCMAGRSGYQRNPRQGGGNYNPRGAPPPASSNQTIQDRTFLWAVFQRVDRDNNGTIDHNELQYALSNGTWTKFNPETVAMMISMFDQNGDARIDFAEFAALWKYVQDWQKTFQRFDADDSKNIDKGELKQCLEISGYRLSDYFYDILINRYDRSRTGNLNFDDFIQVCVTLQVLTAAFREKDTNRNGRIDVGYEEFLTMIVKSRV